MPQQRQPDEVLREMSHIRRQFREDVEDVVDSAREFADWKSYVRAHPWICIGAAMAAGYLMVPSRYEIQSPDADALKKLAKQNRLVVEANPSATARTSMLGSAATFMGHLLLRQALALAGQKLGAIFAVDGQEESDARETVRPYPR